MKDNSALPKTRFKFKTLLSPEMPSKRAPFTSLENEAVVAKRRRTTTAKAVPTSSTSESVKSKPQVSRTKVLKPSDKELAEKLPIPPQFDYFQSPFPVHNARPLLPAKQLHSPLDLFGLFFGNSILESIVTNTNRYAELKRLPFQPVQDTPELDREKTLGVEGSGETAVEERPWNLNPMSCGELKVFVGLQILIGVYQYPGIEDYWSGGQGVKHPEFEKMSCNRYLQIKRYFHLSPPDETYQWADWWRKMEPLASHLRRCFQKLYLPGSNVAFDEMMVLFEGRSLHTIKMPSKSIDQGYKIYALCNGVLALDVSPRHTTTGRS